MIWSPNYNQDDYISIFPLIFDVHACICTCDVPSQKSDRAKMHFTFYAHWDNRYKRPHGKLIYTRYVIVIVKRLRNLKKRYSGSNSEDRYSRTRDPFIQKFVRTAWSASKGMKMFNSKSIFCPLYYYYATLF